MNLGGIFNLILVYPAVNALLLFHFVFDKIGLPSAFGLSIIALTALIRLLFQPFYAKQMDMAAKMEEMRPEMDKLSKKFKNDKQRLQQEQLKLYQKKGINPASGCLVALLQMPVFIALYQVLRMFLENGGLKTIAVKVNKLVYADFLKISHINPYLLGFDLSVAPSQFQQYGWHYLLIPLVTAGLQFLQVQMQSGKKLSLKNSADKDTKDGRDDSKESLIEKKDEKPNTDDMQKMMSQQMKFMFPAMIGYFSFILPAGLALYWNVFSLFTIFQYINKNGLLKRHKKIN